MARLSGWGFVVLGGVLAVGCAYPRRGTSLTPAGNQVQSLGVPAHVWKLRLVGASVPPQRRGGMDWDEDGGLPDAFVRIYRGGELVFESPVREDTLEPTFDEALPKNVWLPPDQEVRLELWDRDDGPANDPIGIWRGQGLPGNAVPDADARISMENGASLTLRLSVPEAHRGVGVAQYEVRSDELILLEVLEHSPAGRAGLSAGDRVVSIGGRRVEEMSEAEAASALSMAADRREALSVRKTSGQEEEVELDRGYVWLTM